MKPRDVVILLAGALVGAVLVWSFGHRVVTAGEEPATVADATAADADVVKATLTMDEQDQAAWQAINNTFVRFGDPDYKVERDFREGLLIQPGMFLHYMEQDPIDLKLKMEFREKKGGTPVKVLERDDFKEHGEKGRSIRWVNIVGGSLPTGPQVTVGDLCWLIPGWLGNEYSANECRAPRDKLECSGIDECALRGESCSYSSGAGRLKPIPKPCVRTSQIHGRFEPFEAVITYWQGPNRYVIRATTGVENRNTYTFELNDPVTIFLHWSDKLENPEKLENIGEIVMRASTVPTHGPHYDPPW